MEKSWSYLRRKFLTERRRLNNVPSGAAASDSKTTWGLYTAMMFIDKKITSRAVIAGSLTNFDETSCSEDQQEYELQPFSDSYEYQDTEYADYDYLDQSDDEIDLLPPALKTPVNEPKLPSSPFLTPVQKQRSKKKLNLEAEKAVNETLGVVKEYFKGKNPVGKENVQDKNKIFCDLLYASLSQSDIQTQQDVRRKINGILAAHNLD